MSDYEEIDDQAGFLAPMFGQLNEVWPQPPLGPAPEVFCTRCGKQFEMFRGMFGWTYNSVIILGTPATTLGKDEFGYPKMTSTDKPARYCEKCASEISLNEHENL